jgi:hypothetical protein
VIGSLARACAYGVNVRFDDLGDWGDDELRAEYDPAVPEIRLNIRVAASLPIPALGEFVAFAVGHELYHHREHLGEVKRIDDRREREAAADDFARSLIECTT